MKVGDGDAGNADWDGNASGASTGVKVVPAGGTAAGALPGAFKGLAESACEPGSPGIVEAAGGITPGETGEPASPASRTRSASEGSLSPAGSDGTSGTAKPTSGAPGIKLAACFHDGAAPTTGGGGAMAGRLGSVGNDPGIGPANPGVEAAALAGRDCPKASGNAWPGSARKNELANAANSATEMGASAASAPCPGGTAEGTRFVGSGLFVLMVTANFNVLENPQRILSEDGG